MERPQGDGPWNESRAREQKTIGRKPPHLGRGGNAHGWARSGFTIYEPSREGCPLPTGRPPAAPPVPLTPSFWPGNGGVNKPGGTYGGFQPLPSLVSACRTDAAMDAGRDAATPHRCPKETTLPRQYTEIPTTSRQRSRWTKEKKPTVGTTLDQPPRDNEAHISLELSLALPPRCSLSLFHLGLWESCS
ncbi:hypothetical protein LZ30DRAFT_35901 [Colletotrichum cereale]|nr:hypothetical protein LZ30DRAFT_35901 [Colletotrichum cereale]